MVFAPSEVRPMFLLLWDPTRPESQAAARAVSATVEQSGGMAGGVAVETRTSPKLVNWVRQSLPGGEGPEIYVVIRRRSGRMYDGVISSEGLLRFLGECVQEEARARAEESNPVEQVVAVSSGTGHPVAVIALALMKLAEEGRIGEEDLETIGMTRDELDQMRQAFEYNATLEAFEQELETYAKLRSYRRQIKEIAVELGIANDATKEADLQYVLAEFALENNVRDLRTALRFLRAEDPGRIPGP